MGNPLRGGRPVGARDHRSGPAFEQWKLDRAAEIAEEQRQQAEAQAAADLAATQTPEAKYQASINELHAQEQHIVLNGVMSDAYLSQFKQFGTLKRGSCSESEAIAARVKFRETASTYIRNSTNGATLVAMVKRNGLLESDPASYAVCWEICKIWGLVVDADPVEQPETRRYENVQVVDPRSLLTPSERAVYDHQQYCEKIIGHDESGQGFTEAMLDELPAKQALRLRRLFESGTRGSNLLTVRREILDIKAAQDAQREQQAAEDDGLDGPSISAGQYR